MNEPNGHPPEPDTFPLDDAAIAYLAELDEQMRRTMEALNQQATGMMTYFMRAHDLKGPWKLAPNRRELVLEEPAPVTQQS